MRSAKQKFRPIVVAAISVYYTVVVAFYLSLILLIANYITGGVECA